MGAQDLVASLLKRRDWSRVAMRTTVADIAKLVGGKLVRGDASRELCNVAGLEQADENCISFYGNARYRTDLKTTKAGLVLLADEKVAVSEGPALILVENPVIAFDLVVRVFGIRQRDFVAGVCKSAYVHPGAEIDASEVHVAPNASVLEGAKIGKGTRIGAGTVVGEDVIIGENCEIGANVTIGQGCVIGNRVKLHPGVVIGADGFGFELADGRHYKIEQLGIVRIGDDVEIGASTTVDRARFGITEIGEGTKIDNQVQIGHNCIIGKHCIIVAQTGISGSTRIGDYVTLAAQCGVAGHLSIADHVTCAARAGVISSIREPGGTYFGFPARPIKDDRRDAMRIKQLGNLLKRVKELESLVRDKKPSD